MRQLILVFNNGIFHLFLLFIIVVVVYCPIFDNDFVYMWDDGWQLFTRTTESGFEWNNIVNIFIHTFRNQYFPLNQFFYMLVYSFGGDYNAFSFHCFSLLFHFLNSLLVYFLFIKLLNLSGKVAVNRVRIVSFITAFAFIIHPVNVESVAWVSASKVLIYTFFYLSSIYIYILYKEKNKMKYLIISLLLFVLSFGAKEQAAILPLCLYIIDCVLGKYSEIRTFWNEKLCYWILAVFMGVFTLYISRLSSLVEQQYSIVERIVYASYSYMEYIFKWIFPINLLYLYPFPSLPNEPMPFWVTLYPLFLLIIVISLKETIYKYWFLKFGVLFFTINLLLVLHFIPLPRMAVVADRYLYMPSIGLSFILSYTLVYVFLSNNRLKYYFCSICFIYFVYCMCYTHKQIQVWYNSNTLKEKVQRLLEERIENQEGMIYFD